jgi:DNA-binding NarL/FixJ family response regulator
MTPVPEERPSSVPSPDHKKPFLKICIADDHVLFNDGIKLLLAPYPSLQVVHQVFTGVEVEAAIKEFAPDLLLLDINLPGFDGLEISQRLKKEYPALKIILLSMYSDQKFIKKAQQLGIEGYLLKSTTQAELFKAIETVSAGGSVYFSAKAEPCAHTKDSFMEKYKLTQRELEILRLIKEGRTSAEIADAIYLSVYTVETHRRNINLKLGIKNPVELVNKAIEMGL